MGLMTGDIGINLKGGIIGDLTFGKANHVWMVSDGKIYETEAIYGGGRGRSGFVDIHKYDKTPYISFRRNGINAATRIDIIAKCKEREGTPYSYWDCLINLILIPISIFPRWKEKLAQKLNNDKWTKCDEEVMRVWWDVSKPKEFKNYGGMNPESLLDVLLSSPNWSIVERNIPDLITKILQVRQFHVGELPAIGQTR